MLSVIRHFIVFMRISVLQLLCGNTTEDCLWWMPKFFRNCCLTNKVNSGLLFDDPSSEMPNVITV